MSVRKYNFHFLASHFSLGFVMIVNHNFNTQNIPLAEELSDSNKPVLGLGWNTWHFYQNLPCWIPAA